MATTSFEQTNHHVNKFEALIYDDPNDQVRLTRAIQRILGEDPCFATSRRQVCAELCAWRHDCLKIES